MSKTPSAPPHAWQSLNECYQRKGLVLALGAGSSFGSHLPNWEELLRRLAVASFGEAGRARYDDLRRRGWSLPAIAAILEGNCDGNFAERIRDLLYRDFPFYKKSRKAGEYTEKELADFVDGENTTLKAVAAMCARPDPRGGFMASHKIGAIVNFNLDAVLQGYMHARYPNHDDRHPILRTIDRPSAGAIPPRINVYHLHGYLQFDRRFIGRDEHEAPDLRIFTEHEYFDFFNRPTSVFTYTFLYLLREHHVLFVGLSMDDENLRRLLYYSKRERELSFARERVNFDEARVHRHFAILQRDKDPEINRLVEQSLYRLGTKVCWVNEFAEIPTRLEWVKGGVDQPLELTVLEGRRPARARSRAGRGGSPARKR